MNEKITLLERSITELRQQMKASYDLFTKAKTAEAAAEGDEKKKHATDRAKHKADIELAAAKIKDEEEELAVAVSIRDAENRAANHNHRESEPARARIAQPVAQLGATGRVVLPATPRRHGPLRAHRGENAVQRAELAGMWAAATIYGDATARRWCAENGIEFGRGAPAATLNTTDNNSAGVFVPNEVEYSILELAEVYGVLRQYAEVVPMASGTKDSPRWTRGMTAYWVGEGNKPPSTDPAWDMIKLVAKDLKAMTKMSKNLDEDSVIDLGDKVVMCMAEAFFLAEDLAGFIGDGTSTHGGTVGLTTKLADAANAASLHTAAAGNVSALTLDWDDFNNTAAKYPNYQNATPRWFMNKRVYQESIHRIQTNAPGAMPVDFARPGQMQLGAYAVVFVNAMPEAPTAGQVCAILADLSISTKVGDRRGRIIESGYENDDFTKGLISVVGTQRVDIVNHTIVDPRTASKAGPVMGLRLAAS
jgi:HK97 family phage major capsid protein